MVAFWVVATLRVFEKWKKSKSQMKSSPIQIRRISLSYLLVRVLAASYILFTRVQLIAMVPHIMRRLCL